MSNWEQHQSCERLPQASTCWPKALQSSAGRSSVVQVVGIEVVGTEAADIAAAGTVVEGTDRTAADTAAERTAAGCIAADTEWHLAGKPVVCTAAESTGDMIGILGRRQGGQPCSRCSFR